MSTNKTILKLKIALGHYTDATGVQSWGMEELSDEGEGARIALGFDAYHAADCAWPNGYNKPSEYDEETGKWSEVGEYISGESCTCGLQARINEAILAWIKELES